MVTRVGQLSATESVYSISASGAVSPVSTGPLGSGFVVLDANVTFAFPTAQAGTYLRQRLTLQQNTLGGWVTSFPASVTWVGGAEPTPPLKPSDFSTYEFVSRDGGTTWIGLQVIAPTAPKVFDKFTRSDNATTLGSAPIGGAWTAHAGTWGISGNTAYLPSQVADSVATLDTTLTDHSVFVDIIPADGSSQPTLVGRVLDANNFWLVQTTTPNASPQSLILWKKVAGVYTNMGGGNLPGNPMTPGLPTRLGLSFVGNVITVTCNGISIVTGTFVEAGLAGNTRAGLRQNASTVGNKWDNFVSF